MNFAQTFKALSNPIRRSILELLKGGEIICWRYRWSLWCGRSDHFPSFKPPQAGRFNSRGKREEFYLLWTQYFSLGGFNGLARWFERRLYWWKWIKTIDINFYGDTFPHALGLMIWPQLPNQIPIHFNAAGQPITSNRNPWLCFGLPIFDLMVHLFVIFMIGRDPKNSAMNEKMIRAIHWLTPIVSLSTSYLIYSKALGSTTNPSVFVSVLLGLIFVIMGNYMPKLKVNHTVGIRLSWTLQSEDNWHKTHRLAGSCGSSEGWFFYLKQAFNSRFLMYWCWSSSPLCLSLWCTLIN